MTKLDSSTPMPATDYPLAHPEDYLWVRLADDRLTVIDGDRLRKLYYGTAAPEDKTEEKLVQNREWLRVHVKHCLGEWPITVPVAGPLPEWNPRWLWAVCETDKPPLSEEVPMPPRGAGHSMPSPPVR